MKVGDKVTIRKGTRYDNVDYSNPPHGVCGTVTRFTPNYGEYCIGVDWPNNQSNEYCLEDLELYGKFQMTRVSFV